MIEGRLIIPQSDNAGASLAWAHAHFEREACDYFGGFTRTEARGGWRGSLGLDPVQVEAVNVYAVAGDPFKLADFFADWATDFLRESDQFAVYTCVGSRVTIYPEGERCEN